MKVYVCKKCGNVILKLEDKTEALECCQQKMDLVTPNTVEASLEKHLPIYNVEENIINITVGDVIHPMSDEHYISFIILASDNDFIIKKFSSKDQPVASFAYNKDYTKIYAYCNLHGLWLTEIEKV